MLLGGGGRNLSYSIWGGGEGLPVIYGGGGGGEGGEGRPPASMLLFWEVFSAKIRRRRRRCLLPHRLRGERNLIRLLMGCCTAAWLGGQLHSISGGLPPSNAFI